MEIKASDAVARLLAKNNIPVAFELIGGMIAHLVDSIGQMGATKIISMRHEQGAAFAAGGLSRAAQNGEIGLALATSGPGATNLITGIADCWFDSVPCLFLTGQVNTTELKGELNIRQQGFQELDIVSLVSSITKYSKRVDSADELLIEIQKAINAAKEGRKGPSLIDIPMDVQSSMIKSFNFERAEMLGDKKETISYNPSEQQILHVEKLLKASSKPLFLFGGGIRYSKKMDELLKFMRVKSIPYVASLKGSEILVGGSGYLGMIGSYGVRSANKAVQECDLLIVLGSRLDVRQTGALADDFGRNAKLIQIDIDDAQLRNRVIADISINTDIDTAIECFLPTLELIHPCDKWCSEAVDNYKNTFVDEYSDWGLSPHLVFEALGKKFSGYEIHYVADVGNNQMWAAHSLLLDSGQMLHHSGGLGAMGFSLPTAIGVFYATKKPVVAMMGDGGAQLNIQELDVISKEGIPILVIVFNNESLGMVRNFQEMYFDGRNKQTYWDGNTCSFEKIAAGYLIESSTVNSLKGINNVLDDFKDSPRPFLLEVKMPEAKECRPRLPYGACIDKQAPKSSKVEN